MELRIKDDFDLDKIAGSGQCFRWERREDGAYRIPFGQNCLRISRTGEGCFDLDCSRKEYEAIWHGYFDLDTEYRTIRERISPEEDPFLFRAAAAQRGVRILRQDPWEVTVSFIISQNRSIPAIRRSVELLCRAAGERRTDSEGRPFYPFPEPPAVLRLDRAGLDACALGYRDKYILAAAEAACRGELDFQALSAASGEAALKKLMEFYGVGVKVASCISLFGLHHMDAFPVDTWIRRVLAAEYPGGYPLRRYSPYNGVYQQYMFAYYRDRTG